MWLAEHFTWHRCLLHRMVAVFQEASAEAEEAGIRLVDRSRCMEPVARAQCASVPERLRYGHVTGQ
jgi:hypothetical protein